jgi:ATP adenylyltransferase
MIRVRLLNFTANFIYEFPIQNLDAYWRIDYVEIPQSEKSKEKDPFVEILKEDKTLLLLIGKGEFSYAALNKFPYNAEHSMVLPYR